MILPTRTDPSVIGKWWWTVDRWMLLALLTLSVIGILMAMAASPAVAERLGLESFHFVRRQIIVFHAGAYGHDRSVAVDAAWPFDALPSSAFSSLSLGSWQRC